MDGGNEDERKKGIKEGRVKKNVTVHAFKTFSREKGVREE